MIIENKSIPEAWIKKPEYLKIIRKVLKNKEMKNLAIKNIKNNIQKDEYNNNLKENLPKILKTNSPYGYDNDLMTLPNKRKSNAKIKIYKNINDEYNDMIKKQNTKINGIVPTQISQNLKNILEYRKKLALKYNIYNTKSNNPNLVLQKSKSQNNNLIKKCNFNTISTGNEEPTTKGINNIKYYIHRNKSNFLKNNLTDKEKAIKEYKENYQITEMNNKQLRDIIIGKQKSNKININNNIKKSKSVLYKYK